MDCQSGRKSTGISIRSRISVDRLQTPLTSQSRRLRELLEVHARQFAQLTLFTAYSPDTDESYRAVRDDEFEALDDDSGRVEHSEDGYMEGVTARDDEHEERQETRIHRRSCLSH